MSILTITKDSKAFLDLLDLILEIVRFSIVRNPFVFVQIYFKSKS